MPDLSFTLDERLYARLMRSCSHELSLWGAADDLHMMIIATFQVSEGPPRLAELSLMLVTEQWLPVEDLFERQLIHSLAQHRRSFFKALRYNLDRRHPVASAILTDTSQGPIVMRLERGVADEGSADALTDESQAAQDPLLWTWRTNIGPMPPLPA